MKKQCFFIIMANVFLFSTYGTSHTASQESNLIPVRFLLLINNTNIPITPITPVPLNDTGITWGGNYPSGNNTDCSGIEIGAQDCSHGRDWIHNDNSDGHAGFSFTKLDASGIPLVDQSVEYTTTPWACVKDNVTGLVWEVKTDDSGLHDKDDSYNWYNTDPITNGGANGYADDDGNICYGYDSSNSSTFCNTQAYIARVNATGWCGATDWRMPAIEELQGIVSYNRSFPSIDTEYFPNTLNSLVWSGSPGISGCFAAYILFQYGGMGYGACQLNYQVRLVRGGQ